MIIITHVLVDVIRLMMQFLLELMYFQITILMEEVEVFAGVLEGDKSLSFFFDFACIFFGFMLN